MSTPRETAVAAAEAALVAARAKVDKLEAHLEGARDGVSEAEAALAAAEGADYPDAVDGEHVTAEAGHAAGTGDI